MKKMQRRNSGSRWSLEKRQFLFVNFLLEWYLCCGRNRVEHLLVFFLSEHLLVFFLRHLERIVDDGLTILNAYIVDQAVP